MIENTPNLILFRFLPHHLLLWDTVRPSAALSLGKVDALRASAQGCLGPQSQPPPVSFCPHVPGTCQSSTIMLTGLVADYSSDEDGKASLGAFFFRLLMPPPAAYVLIESLFHAPSQTMGKNRSTMCRGRSCSCHYYGSLRALFGKRRRIGRGGGGNGSEAQLHLHWLAREPPSWH
jgi:hypothetical protein